MACDLEVPRQQRKQAAAALKLGTMIGLIVTFASGAIAAKETSGSPNFQRPAVRVQGASARGRPSTPAQLPNSAAAQDEISPNELATYLAANDVQRVPFDSTLATIKTCIRGPQETILTCLDAKQACETDAGQCAYAAEQAWQVYIAHYLRLLRKRGAAATPEASQNAWATYAREECEFESTLYPNDAPMRHVVGGTCRASKAQDRALELRSALIDAGN